MNEHFQLQRSEEYNQRFSIEHLTFSQKNESDKNTLENILRQKIKAKNIYDKKIIFDTDNQIVEIRKIENNDNFLLLFISVADKSAILPVSPGQNHLEDNYQLDDYNTHHVFLLIKDNKVYGCIKIKDNKLYTRVNFILRYLGIDGNVTEDIDISSVELVRKEGIRGLIYHSEHSSEDLIDYNNAKKLSKKEKSKRLFNRLFGTPPPVLDSRIVGDIHIDLKDNQTSIKVDPEKNIEVVVENLHTDLILVTNKGRRITGQNFAMKKDYYLREHTKDTVTFTAAFEALTDYFTNKL